MRKRSHIINTFNPIDTYRTLHPITAQCTFFLNKLGNFVKMDHFLDRKARIHKFMNNLKVIKYTFSDKN